MSETAQAKPTVEELQNKYVQLASRVGDLNMLIAEANQAIGKTLEEMAKLKEEARGIQAQGATNAPAEQKA